MAFCLGINKTNITLEDNDKKIDFEKLNTSIIKSKIDFDNKIENIISKDLTDQGDNISAVKNKGIFSKNILF